jgi:hypothetical protein
MVSSISSRQVDAHDTLPTGGGGGVDGLAAVLMRYPGNGAGNGHSPVRRDVTDSAPKLPIGPSDPSPPEQTAS